MSQLRDQLITNVVQHRRDDYLAREQVEQLTGVSYQRLLTMRKRGEFPDYDMQDGARLYWKRLKVEQWLAYRTAIRAAAAAGPHPAPAPPQPPTSGPPRPAQAPAHPAARPAPAACPKGLRAKHQLTNVNGIKRKPNGKYIVYLRLLGQGTTRILTESASTIEQAIEVRNLAIHAAGVPASSVGITKVPLGWRASVRWDGGIYHLGTYADEADAAALRIRFDAWAAGRSEAEVKAMLDLHCREQPQSRNKK